MTKGLSGYYKISFAILCAFILCLPLCYPNTYASTPQEIVVGTYPNKPMVFQTSAGLNKGFFIDILNHIAANEGWRITYRHDSWAKQLARLKNAEIDILVDIAHSVEREEFFSFNHEKVLLNWGQVYLPEGSPLHSVIDLKGKKVAIVAQDIHSINFLKLIDTFQVSCIVIEADSYADVFGLIADGVVDAGVSSRMFGMFNEDSFNVVSSPIFFSPINLMFAASKGQNLQLLATIDSYISALKNDQASIYYKSLDSWFGPKIKKPIPKWVILAFFVIIFVVLVLVVITIMLRRMVIYRSRELAASYENEKLLKDIERMSRHDMKSPLNAVIGFSDLMLEEGELSDEHQTFVKHIRESGYRLIEIVNLSLNLFKMEQGTYQLDAKKLDLLPIINAIFADNKSISDATNISTRVKVDESDLDNQKHFYLFGEDSLCYTLFSNLIKNAVEASPESGLVTVSVKHNESACIVIHNEGAVPTHIKDSFFEKYMTYGKKEGTGLGTYSAKLMVETQGGNIYLESDDVNGTSVFVELPNKFF